MKILFIHLGKEQLGIEYISSLLKQAGHSVYLINDPGLFSREDNVFYIPILEKVFAYRKEEILQRARKINPDVIAFSVYSTTYQWSKAIAAYLKKELNLPIVFGGPHVTLVPEEVLKNTFVDFIIIGEGEYPMLNLVEALEKGDTFSRFKKINSLGFKENSKLIINPMDEPVDLDVLPFPDKELFREYINYKYDYLIMTGRGCPGRCTYCCEGFYSALYKGKNVRKRSISNVIEELKMAKEKYNCEEVIFYDTDFLRDKSWVYDFLPLYKDQINIPFKCLAHIRNIDRDTVNLLKKCGCYCLNFGIQIINNQIKSQVLYRPETEFDVLNILRICDEVRLRYDLDTIVGLPNEKEEDHLFTIECIKNGKLLNRVKCFYLAYFPNLPIVEEAYKKGYLDDKDLQDIKEGKRANFIYPSHKVDKKDENLRRFYRVFPFLPKFIINLISKYKLYRFFYRLPLFLIIMVELLNGIKKRDYRFTLYIKNYIYQIRRRLSGKFEEI